MTEEVPEGPELDDWDRSVHRGPTPITFTQHHAQLEVTLTRHVPDWGDHRFSVSYGAWRTGSLRCPARPRLSVHRAGQRFTRQDLQVHPGQQAWTAANLVAHLTGHLRRCGRATMVHLERHAYLLGPPSRPLADFLRHHSAVFVPCGPDEWTLTPWARLGVPFQVESSIYEREAVRFWLAHRYQPSAQEEWSDVVRAHVAHHLSVAPLPPYFRPDRHGGFQHAEVGLWRRVGLSIDTLPEGLYWTRSEATFSVTGRALICETTEGPVVVTRQLERRFREVLLNPDGVTLHPAGSAFVKACRAARVEPLPV